MLQSKDGNILIIYFQNITVFHKLFWASLSKISSWKSTTDRQWVRKYALNGQKCRLKKNVSSFSRVLFSYFSGCESVLAVLSSTPHSRVNSAPLPSWLGAPSPSLCSLYIPSEAVCSFEENDLSGMRSPCFCCSIKYTSNCTLPV